MCHKADRCQALGKTTVTAYFKLEGDAGNTASFQQDIVGLGVGKYLLGHSSLLFLPVHYSLVRHQSGNVTVFSNVIKYQIIKNVHFQPMHQSIL